MTIAISTRIGEGLVYAADSTSSYFETFETLQGPQSRLAQSYHYARKLIQLENYPVGILTFGLGQIGTRNLESMVVEFEHQLAPFGPGLPYTIEALAGELHQFLLEKYNAVHQVPAVGAPDNRPRMGVVIGGFSKDEYQPDEWLLMYPDGATAQRTRLPGDLGVRWWGVTEPITRLVVGADQGLVTYLVAKGVTQQEADNIYAELGQQLRWNVVFDGMPLQDAIDLSVYLANVTIGHSRFVFGPPVCGGHVDVAAITHRGFAWIRQKKPGVKGDSVFY